MKDFAGTDGYLSLVFSGLRVEVRRWVQGPDQVTPG